MLYKNEYIYGKFSESISIPKHAKLRLFYYRCDKFIKDYERNMYIGMTNCVLAVVK